MLPVPWTCVKQGRKPCPPGCKPSRGLYVLPPSCVSYVSSPMVRTGPGAGIMAGFPFVARQTANLLEENPKQTLHLPRIGHYACHLGTTHPRRISLPAVPFPSSADSHWAVYLLLPPRSALAAAPRPSTRALLRVCRVHQARPRKAWKPSFDRHVLLQARTSSVRCR